ncbi:MAG: hypothetical protein QNK11_08905 [Legionella sp.]|nr:hypothetical protein [Legionella sp.]
MKKTRFAVAALLTSLSAISVIPVAYAEEGTPPMTKNDEFGVQYGVTLCKNCDRESCTCGFCEGCAGCAGCGGRVGRGGNHEGVPPVEKDNLLGVTVCEKCDRESCTCGFCKGSAACAGCGGGDGVGQKSITAPTLCGGCSGSQND